MVAAIGTNDNHEVRTLPAPEGQKGAEQPRRSADDAFAEWLKQPDRLGGPARAEEYPVFVVSTQGGGIYAAHNAATFLARMQDLCPAFRRHLFAISSVSGGSVGAATFAAALHSSDHQAGSGSAQSGNLVECARIAQHLAGTRSARGLNDAGAAEIKVQTVLSSDFLSPLVGASLFPEFTQAFLPFPIRPFDRARALEYTLENAAEQMYDGPQDRRSVSNLLKADYQAHWRADNGMPALVMNATDAGSGKRVVIAPFDFHPKHPRELDFCMLSTVTRKVEEAEEKVLSTSLQIPLSTAAFISARFPWVTPAATVSIKNDCITKKAVARLVDGGYIDNSGVETALNSHRSNRAGAQARGPRKLSNLSDLVDRRRLPRSRAVFLQRGDGAHSRAPQWQNIKGLHCTQSRTGARKIERFRSRCKLQISRLSAGSISAIISTICR